MPQTSVDTSHAHSLRENWKAAALVFAACLALYYVHFGTITAPDCLPAPYTAWAIATRGSFDLRPYAYVEKLVGGAVVETREGRWITKYPPGSALVAVPFALPFTAFHAEPLQSGGMRRLGKLVAASCVAAAAALLYLVCAGLAPRGAALATAVFAAGTCLWPVASQGLWTHGPATLWVVLALYALLRPPSRGARALAGLALGMAVLTRPTTALFAVASLAALAWRVRLSQAGVTALAAAVPVAALLVHGAYYFGAPLAAGYGDEASRWTTPFWYGFAGLLASPSRGLLVYTPAFLALPFGLRRVVEAARGSLQGTLIAAWLVAALATAAAYACWHVWWGGWCYGPRFLSETLPILCVLLAFSFDRVRTRAGRGAIVGLVALSVAIQALGVIAEDASSDWHRRHRKGPGFELRDTQIEAHVRKLFGLDPWQPSRGGGEGWATPEPTS